MKRFTLMFAFLLSLPAWAGLDEGIAAYTAGDYAKALVEFQALADQGNMDGQYFVGFFYHNGSRNANIKIMRFIGYPWIDQVGIVTRLRRAAPTWHARR